MTRTKMAKVRRDLALKLLETGPKSGAEISAALGYVQGGGVTHLMAQLEAAGLITAARNGRAAIYALKGKREPLGVPTVTRLVPLEKGAGPNAKAVMRITLPAAPWEVRA